MLATVAPTALNVFYGSDYVSGATALAILAISIILSALFTLLTTTLTAIGETKQVLRINLISALVAVTLLMGLVSVFDVVGAAVTRLAVRTLSLLLAVSMLRKYVSVQLDREALWKSAVASMLCVPVLFVLESAMTKSFPVVQVLTAEILAAGAVYLASLYVLKALNGQDFELLRQYFPKSFSKLIDGLQKIMTRT